MILRVDAARFQGLLVGMIDDEHPFESRDSEEEGLPEAYLAFFDRFNQGGFFEAHEVLEELWLDCRGAPIGDFYKGLIQLAGVFVHLEHGRPAPAAALLRLAHRNLSRYPTPCQELDVNGLCDTIRTWLVRVEGGEPPSSLCDPAGLPRLGLIDPKARPAD